MGIYDDISSKLTTKFDTYINADVGKIIENKIDSTLTQVVDSIFTEIDTKLATVIGQNAFLSGLNSMFIQNKIMNTKSHSFRGVKLSELKTNLLRQTAIKYAKKNLFIVEASSKDGGKIESAINLFVTAANYTSVSISGEKKNIGTSVVDIVSGTQAIDLSLECFDDDVGSVRKWFEALSEKVANKDGTVGVPSDYAVVFTITHGVIDKANSGFEFKKHFRPVSLEVSANRADEALTELSLSFTQLDTFFNGAK